MAERCGDLVGPGTATVQLEAGFYSFRTLSDATLRLVHGGVDARTNTLGKDPPIPPPAQGEPLRGDELPGEPPRFTVESGPAR